VSIAKRKVDATRTSKSSPFAYSAVLIVLPLPPAGKGPSASSSASRAGGAEGAEALVQPQCRGDSTEPIREPQPGFAQARPHRRAHHHRIGPAAAAAAAGRRVHDPENDLRRVGQRQRQVALRQRIAEVSLEELVRQARQEHVIGSGTDAIGCRAPVPFPQQADQLVRLGRQALAALRQRERARDEAARARLVDVAQQLGRLAQLERSACGGRAQYGVDPLRAHAGAP
jgi:hypothetical protein